MQTDGSPPASDRLKSFTLDKNELAMLLARKLTVLNLINFGMFAAESSRRGELMVITNFERCLKSDECLLELAEVGHRLTVGFGWSPHDGSGLTYRSFLLELHHFYKLGRSLQGAELEAHLKHLLTCYRDTLNFAGDAARADATRLPQMSQHYKPSYARRLILADIAGPFICLQREGWQLSIWKCPDSIIWVLWYIGSSVLIRPKGRNSDLAKFSRHSQTFLVHIMFGVKTA
eukprot:3389615-Pleurochrysis_carterae.AAC.1